jgi:glycosyltransferase involved in cell wall biosynthesis
VRRVLLVFDPPDGGVAENVRRLALGISGYGWQPYVAGPRESIIYDDLRAAGVPIARLPFQPGYDHPRADIKTLRQLTMLMRRGSFDLVHSHNAKAGVLARLAARSVPAPAIYSPHCFPFVAPYSRPRLWTSTTIEWFSGYVTDVLLCVAEEERRIAIEYDIVPEEQLCVIHNGCPPCEGGLEPDAEIEAFRAGRPLAATLCVLREQKAVHVFVDAAPAILERCPDAVLAVIGNGELEDELKERAAKLSLGDRFGFFPFRQPSSRQLGSMDVLVLSSSWEAFPISILEAMACGVPQVATDVGGTGEALEDGETGFLCPPEDPAALADRVSRLLLDSDLRERFGQAARARYEREFRVETMVEKTGALYDDVVRDAAERTPPQSWRDTASGLKRAATKRRPSAPVRDASSGSSR